MAGWARGARGAWEELRGQLWCASVRGGDEGRAGRGTFGCSVTGTQYLLLEPEIRKGNRSI